MRLNPCLPAWDVDPFCSTHSKVEVFRFVLRLSFDVEKDMGPGFKGTEILLTLLTRKLANFSRPRFVNCVILMQYYHICIYVHAHT